MSLHKKWGVGQKEEEREKLDVTFSCMTKVEELNFKVFTTPDFSNDVFIFVSFQVITRKM